MSRMTFRVLLIVECILAKCRLPNFNDFNSLQTRTNSYNSIKRRSCSHLHSDSFQKFPSQSSPADASRSIGSNKNDCFPSTSCLRLYIQTAKFCKFWCRLRNGIWCRTSSMNIPQFFLHQWYWRWDDSSFDCDAGRRPPKSANSIVKTTDYIANLWIQRWESSNSWIAHSKSRNMIVWSIFDEEICQCELFDLIEERMELQQFCFDWMLCHIAAQSTNLQMNHAGESHYPKSEVFFF